MKNAYFVLKSAILIGFVLFFPLMNALLANDLDVGKAKGTMTAEGIEINLQWAYAIYLSDISESNKKAVVIVLTESPLNERPFPNKMQLMFEGLQGKFKGVVAEINGQDKIISMNLANGKTMSQFSETVAFNLEVLVREKLQVNGKIVSVTGRTKDRIAVEFKAKVVETDKCIEMFRVDEKSWQKIPKGGGEPGRAFSLFLEGYDQHDVGIVKAGLCPAFAKHINSETFKNADMRAQNITITGGFVNGNKAMLTGAGKSPVTGNKVNISVWMSKEETGWKVVRQREE